MARYGALSALQAALLGISGGAQGLVQAQEREQREKERKDAAEAQDFARQLAMVQNRVRPMQPATAGAPQPEGYAPVGSFRGVQYEAMTPEAITNQAAQAEVARLRNVSTEQSKLARENFDRQLPELRAALAQFSDRDLPKNVRALVESGAFGLEPSQALKTAFDIAEGNRRLNIEASRAGGATKGTYTSGEITKLIADRVSQFQSEIARATKEVPETRTVNGREIPITGRTKRVPYSAPERKAMVDEFRSNLQAEYAPLMPGGQPAPTGSSRSAAPRTPAPTATLDLGGGTGGQAGSNIERIMNPTAFGMRGEPSPLTYTVGNRTYTLPR